MNEETQNNIGGFKRFVKTASRIVDKISVTTGGVIGYSTSFSSEHHLESYTSVVLYWNENTKEIGVEFSTADSDGTPKLRANKNGYGYTVNAKAFFAVNHIDTDKYHGRFSYRIVPFVQLDPGYTGNENMYVFDITEEEPKRKPVVAPGTVPVNEVVPAPVVDVENNQTPPVGP